MIYLDNAATTKPNQAVLDSFLKVSEKAYYNANSPHQMGLQSEKILLQAKSRVKEMLNLNNNTDVIFTSGATESNNIALKGIALRKKQFANVIITSVLEHPSVLEVMRYLETQGFILKYVNVTPNGQIDINHLEQLMTDNVGLVTCMYVNNVMGQIQPIKEIGSLLKQYPKAHFHVDGVQALGKIPMQLENVNSVSFSGHKFNGLKGQGILIIDNKEKIEPTVFGGGQEYGIRSGTVNLAMNVSLVKAMEIAIQNLNELNHRLSRYNKVIRESLSQYKGVYINSPENSAPHILNIAFPGVKGEVLVNAFSKLDIMVSTTSACSSKREKLNEVLLAMDIEDNRIEGSVRLSMGETTTEKDIEQFKDKFKLIYAQIKELLK
ncbi:MULTISPECIES: cysteine desulfurase family protein [Staphylococcus]|jgi:cysteine desulfurase|uniref:cysteine desulfurase family protein n=1 Tax=Staphylococcus TaxID=1279 RepID=UPI00036D7997|nr:MULTISPECIES: cysteine desulfurase family protein [Staphylococcus]OFK79873.1 aminotransferase [Staphylococcus sp. HMSC057A02]OFM56544.1 aminotransferase [Staphylococcus sp. HMSC059G05]OFM62006.1 aminotransferase [Staphylococcus sp. HMSC062C01]OFR37130.1 aminotransferase [Staphylococcus sp. HMSC063F02]OFU73673.1 aminotransferase [Staphylococcus sp. HMSC10B09]GGO35669.1 aminotransferase [Plantactinospora veratri]